MENIILTFLCLLFCMVAIKLFPIFKQSGLSLTALVLFFGLKIAFGFLLIAVYAKYYPQRNLADAFKYFDDSAIIYANAQSLHLSLLDTYRELMSNTNIALVKNTHHFDKQGSGFFEANHHLIIYIHLLLRYISNGNIYLHSLWFSFFSLIGSVGIYTSLKKHFTETEFWLKLVVFGIPSVLFWSSGMLKETLILMSLGLIGYSYTNRKKMADWKSVSILFLSLLLLLFIKPYVLLGVMLSAFAYWLLKQENRKTLLLAIVVIGVAGSFFFGNNFANQLIHKRNEFITLSEHTNTQSLLDSNIIPENGVMELLKITPTAIYAVFMEPSIFHLNSLKDLPFCIENLLLILVLFFLVLRYPAFNRNKIALSSALLVFAICQFMIIGWTVPVSGAIVRYKVSALPFLAIGLLLHVNLRLFICEINSILGIKK